MIWTETPINPDDATQEESTSSDLPLSGEKKTPLIPFDVNFPVAITGIALILLLLEKLRKHIENQKENEEQAKLQEAYKELEIILKKVSNVSSLIEFCYKIHLTDCSEEASKKSEEIYSKIKPKMAQAKAWLGTYGVLEKIDVGLCNAVHDFLSYLASSEKNIMNPSIFREIFLYMKINLERVSKTKKLSKPFIIELREILEKVSAMF